jgi:hypothetical protein
MQTRFLCAFALLTIAASASAASFRDDSRYVARGPRTGYYIVRPGSVLLQQLGFQGAPFRDTSDPLNHGRGADVLAFRFNTAGVLSAAPAYIVQGPPNDFYMRRIGSFIRGRTTLHDVESFFGRPKQIEKRRGLQPIRRDVRWETLVRRTLIKRTQESRKQFPYFSKA